AATWRSALSRSSAAHGTAVATLIAMAVARPIDGVERHRGARLVNIDRTPLAAEGVCPRHTWVKPSCGPATSEWRHLPIASASGMTQGVRRAEERAPEVAR